MMMGDDFDMRGGYRWACDNCIYNNLYDNCLITITNTDGQIINHKFKQ